MSGRRAWRTIMIYKKYRDHSLRLLEKIKPLRKKRGYHQSKPRLNRAFALSKLVRFVVARNFHYLFTHPHMSVIVVGTYMPIKKILYRW